LVEVECHCRLMPYEDSTDQMGCGAAASKSMLRR
jgi:hypothetical protein